VAAVALHADHLDELAPAADQLGKPLRRLARQRPRPGAHGLGEMRDRRGVEPVRLGEPSGGPREASSTTNTGARRPSRAVTSAMPAPSRLTASTSPDGRTCTSRRSLKTSI
jgi:hypothetical protein